MLHENHGRVTSSTFRYGHAEVTLDIDYDGASAQLVDLHTHSRHRGFGHAKMVLMEATRFADKHHISVWLEIFQDHVSDGLDAHQLVTLFNRFGFDVFENIINPEPSHIFMVREPLPGVHL